MFLFYVIITNTMAYWYDGAALAATRSPVIALFWCLIKFTTTTTTTTSHIITYTANFELQFVPWLRQWNVLTLLVLVTQLEDTKAVQTWQRLPWHGLHWMASF